MILSVVKDELEVVLKRSLISIEIIQIQENCHSRGSSCDNHIFIMMGRMLLTFLKKCFVNQTLIYCSKFFFLPIFFLTYRVVSWPNRVQKSKLSWWTDKTVTTFIKSTADTGPFLSYFFPNLTTTIWFSYVKKQVCCILYFLLDERCYSFMLWETSILGW